MVQNEVPVVPDVPWQVERPVARWKDLWRGAKEHLCDHSNYVETLCELAQQSPGCTQTLEQQTTGGMDEVGQEGEAQSEVAIYFGLISDA